MLSARKKVSVTTIRATMLPIEFGEKSRAEILDRLDRMGFNLKDTGNSLDGNKGDVKITVASDYVEVRAGNEYVSRYELGNALEKIVDSIERLRTVIHVRTEEEEKEERRKERERLPPSARVHRL